MERVNVNGKQTHPVYYFLKEQLPNFFGSFIKWNFTKFLVNKNGLPVLRVGPTKSPSKMEANIVELLKEKN